MVVSNPVSSAFIHSNHTNIVVCSSNTTEKLPWQGLRRGCSLCLQCPSSTTLWLTPSPSQFFMQVTTSTRTMLNEKMGTDDAKRFTRGVNCTSVDCTDTCDKRRKQ